MSIKPIKPEFKAVILAISGLIFTTIELLLIENDVKELLVAPLIVVPVFCSILFPITFPLFFIASTFFYFDFGIPLPAWTYFNISDYLFPILVLFSIGGKRQPVITGPSSTIINTDINTGERSILHMLVLFSAATLISQLTIMSSLNETGVFRALIFTYHSIQLPVTFLLLTTFFNSKTMTSFKKAVLALFIFEIILVLFQQFTTFDNTKPNGTYNHHAMVGNVMLISISWAMAFLFTAKKILSKTAFGIAAFCSLLAIIFSQSRSALIGIIIALSLFILTNFKPSVKFIVYCILATGFLSILYYTTPLKLIIENTFYSSPVGIDMSSYARLWIWKGAWEFFIQAPWYSKLFGHGMGQYSLIPYTLWQEIGKFTSGAHNNFLHALIETGIIGLSAFLGLFYVILRALWKEGKKNPFPRFFFYCTIALLGSGFTQETFWFQNAFASFWLFYMCCLSIVLSGNNKEQPTA